MTLLRRTHLFRTDGVHPETGSITSALDQVPTVVDV